jgi:tetratricopeptide (TPR) repeat protein
MTMIHRVSSQAARASRAIALAAAVLPAIAVTVAIPAAAQAQRGPAAGPSPRKPDADADAKAQAKGHLDRGLKHFAEREYEKAIAEFEAGQKLDPRPDLVFALAQAERLSGDCASAVLYYREFLAGEPPEKQAEAARTNLERCENVLATSRAREDEAAAKAAPPPSVEPTPAPVATEPPPPAEIRIRRPWYTDVLGDVLLGTGVVAAGAGGYFWLRSADSRDAALDATDYGEYTSRLDDAKLERTIAIGALSAGGVLVTAAVVRYLTRGDQVERAPVALVPTPGGLGIAASF